MRLVPANLEINFELIGERESEFLTEFNKLNTNEDDPLGAWFKRAKSKGETKDSDQVLLTLVVELHRKIDELNAFLRNEKVIKVDLEQMGIIDGIGFDGISIQNGNLKAGQGYYARISMPIFPRRDVAIFFEAINQNLGKIIKMHESDESDFNAYVTSRERVMIRELRGKDE